MWTVQKTASLRDPAPSLIDSYSTLEGEITKTTMKSIKQLDTEFNRLLILLDRLLDRIEKEIPVAVRLDYFKRLCPPRISTFNRLLSIRS